MRIAVIGVGYVGLPTTLLLARAGHEVLAVDTQPEVVASLREGKVHLDREALQPMLDDPEVASRITASSEPGPAEAFLITVPTPVDDTRTAPDLTMVEAAGRSIVSLLEPGNLVVLESTVPPGTCDQVLRPILEASGLRVPEQVLLAHAPERVFPGNLLQEIIQNQRVVGGVDRASTDAAMAVYRTFVQGALHPTTARTAEFTKLLENTFRDVNIALANEVATLARHFEVDPFEAITLANLHPRVNLLTPDIGVGGHCIPVDPWFLVAGSGDLARLVPVARALNDAVPARIATQLRDLAGEGGRVVLLGAAYKANVADCREAPALQVASCLQEAGLDVLHIDPLADAFPYPDLREAARDADLMAILVPHDRILADLEEHRQEILQVMRTPRIVGVRDLLS